MSDTRQHAILNYLRRVLGAATDGSVSDAELLRRFVNQRDEAAFELLLWRHAAMVLHVCHRLLRETDAVEDAFQATFLVFVRKAGSISRRESLGGWLYRVAYRIALKAREQSAKRQAVEHGEGDIDLPDTSTEDAAEREMRRIVCEEVDRLPARYRTPIVACFFEGKTHEEAAKQLGWPRGTVASRLARGRELLRRRLLRRGVAFSVSALLGALSVRPAQAELMRFVDSVIYTARLLAAGQAASAVVSAKVAILMKGVVKTMFLARLKVATAVMLVACALGAGGGWLVSQLAATENPESPKAVVEAADKSKQEKMADDRKAIQGVWRLTALETEGENDFDPKGKNPSLVFLADKLILKPEVPGHGVRLLQGAYKLDATKTPKTLDIIRQVSAEEKATLRAIYALEIDSLKICFMLYRAEIQVRDQNVGRRPRPFDGWDFLAPGARPTALATKAGSKTRLVTLKRQAVEKKEKP
jgi:RNA polymerase sigma factor (sigma-70 family)